MRVAINRANDAVMVDGRGMTVDCSALDPAIYVIEWYGTRGVIEFVNDPQGPADAYRANESFDDLSPYQPLLDAWEAARVIADKPPKKMPPPAQSRNLIPADIQGRIDMFVGDIDRQDLVTLLKTSSPDEIKRYMNMTVTDLASARAMLTKLALLVTLVVDR